MTMQAFHAAQVAYLSNLCTALARYRRRVPADDLVTCLVNAELDGRPLDDEEILSTMLLLVVAGDDTTKQATTLGLLALHANPAERDWLREDFEGRIDDALEELIRYASPVIAFTRTARVPIELHGVSIAAGDKVALFYCSGNRDAEVFTAPGTLDLATPCPARRLRRRWRALLPGQRGGAGPAEIAVPGDPPPDAAPGGRGARVRLQRVRARGEGRCR